MKDSEKEYYKAKQRISKSKKPESVKQGQLVNNWFNYIYTYAENSKTVNYESEKIRVYT